MGSITKDQYGGKFVQEFKSALEKSGKGFETVDVSVGLGQALSVKDEDEMVCFLKMEFEIYKKY